MIVALHSKLTEVENLVNLAKIVFYVIGYIFVVHVYFVMHVTVNMERLDIHESFVTV